LEKKKRKGRNKVGVRALLGTGEKVKGLILGDNNIGGGASARYKESPAKEEKKKGAMTAIRSVQ